MTSNQRNWTVFLAATGVVLTVSFAVLAVAGNGDDNIRALLRLSARAAFVLLLIVFVARPLRQLVRTPGTLALLKNRRLLGISFAGVHTAHLVLIFYRLLEVPTFEFDWLARVPGMATYMMMYAMLITSFDRPARAIGPKRWKILHKIGLYWFFIAFAQRELPRSLDNVNLVTSLLTVLIVAALVIRISAYLANRTPKAQPQ
jgi:DMSO/TMAO reductase YedYZ heme-binding membrane subunit